MRRKILVLAAFCSFVTLASPIDEAMKEAIRHGAMARICYRVIDDEGVPVSNATAHVWFSSYARHQDDADWLVSTGSNGMFVVEHRTNESLDCGFDKEGYYHSSDQILFRDRNDVSIKVKDGKWQPYGETRMVVLKKIKKPTAMSVADKRGRRGYPGAGDWVGYDLAKQDWVSPGGNGVYADMKIRFVEQRFNGRDFARTMEVSFEDIPYGGAYLMDSDEYSEFETSYAVNTNASFASRFKYEFKHKGRELVRDELKKGQYLVFRTRTETYSDGTLKSAHYGVIMGNWKFFERYGMSISKILFNPTPNDTNLEDAETARLSRLGYKQRMDFERSRKEMP